jgi:hypothetical protein
MLPCATIQYTIPNEHKIAIGLPGSNITHILPFARLEIVMVLAMRTAMLWDARAISYYPCTKWHCIISQKAVGAGSRVTILQFFTLCATNTATCCLRQSICLNSFLLIEREDITRVRFAGRRDLRGMKDIPCPAEFLWYSWCICTQRPKDLSCEVGENCPDYANCIRIC